jgi:asparagine synthase (glutamine-hydrolysing)
LIDTISLYSDSEPNWDEKPFFSLVESRRGKSGLHIETSVTRRTFEPFDKREAIYLWPGADNSTLEEERRFQKAVCERGYRVMVSGIGGDELLGGVPTPLPELADHLVSGNVTSFVKSTLAWSLSGRAHFLGLVFEAATFAAGLYLGDRRHPSDTVPWVRSQDRKKKDPRLQKISLRGILPSVINNSNVWNSTLSTLPNQIPPADVRYEYRYPYLDRDLVEFLLRIPREQLIRPGQRRSLMRRALRGIVPEEILQQRRKAYVARGPLILIRGVRSKLHELCHDSLSAQLGVIDQAKLKGALGSADKIFSANWTLPLIRLLEFELWLKVYAAKDGAIRPTFAANDLVSPPRGTRKLRTSGAAR